MKQLFLIAIFFLIVQSSHAQQYLDQTSMWVYHRSMSVGPQPFNEYITITIDGDTTIQGKTYFKRYKQGVHYQGGSLPIVVTPIAKSLLDLIRDDGQYFYAYINGQDSLVMDFTKMVGDSISGVGGCVDTIQSVDTLYLGSQPLREWKTTHYNVIPYIEGVGSVTFINPWHYCSLVGNNLGLVCYEKQGQQLILNSSVNCQVYTSLHDAQETALDITVAPNPTAGNFSIWNTNYTEGQIQLYNLQGQLLLEKELVEGENSMDISFLAGGTYWVKVLTNKGELVKKILKM